MGAIVDCDMCGRNEKLEHFGDYLLCSRCIEAVKVWIELQKFLFKNGFLRRGLRPGGLGRRRAGCRRGLRGAHTHHHLGGWRVSG